ncbi:MAG: hypothetical protein ACR2MK_10965, partial [Solirubrobacteraceae bacterium]
MQTIDGGEHAIAVVVYDDAAELRGGTRTAVDCLLEEKRIHVRHRAACRRRQPRVDSAGAQQIE